MCQEEELWSELHVPEERGEPDHPGGGHELRVQGGEAGGDEAFFNSFLLSNFFIS